MHKIQFAIEDHNKNIMEYNQQMKPNKFDTALNENSQQQPLKIKARNDQSEEAIAAQLYREEVTLKYAGDWAEFRKKSQAR
jgi:hypothetical protein